MTCVICRNGQTGPGKVTVTLQREGSTVIIKGVPADACENCGECYLTESLTEHVLSIGQEAVAKGAEVEIVRYAALPSAPELAAAERRVESERASTRSPHVAGSLHLARRSGCGRHRKANAGP